MGKIITNRHEIAAPPAGRLRYGLFNAATMADLDTRGIGAGYQWVSDHCGFDIQTHDQTCVASPTKAFEEGSDIFGGDPFWVIAGKRCGTVGRTEAQAQQAALAQLQTSEQTLVENVLWNGDGLGTIDPTLTSSGAIAVVPGAAGAGAAIAALEAAFYAQHGYIGTIHVNTAAYAAAAYSNLIVQGAQLTTPLGSVWSFGAGYGITGPDEVAPDPGFVWAFMSPPVTVWRQLLDQVPARATLDRTANQWETVAERVYIVAYDCQDDVFAVQVPVAAPATTDAPAVP